MRLFNIIHEACLRMNSNYFVGNWRILASDCHKHCNNDEFKYSDSQTAHEFDESVPFSMLDVSKLDPRYLQHSSFFQNMMSYHVFVIIHFNHEYKVLLLTLVQLLNYANVIRFEIHF